MTLDEWLTHTGTKEEAFATTIGTSQVNVNRWRRRQREPRIKPALRIVEATGGAVQLIDLIIDQDERSEGT